MDDSEVILDTEIDPELELLELKYNIKHTEVDLKFLKEKYKLLSLREKINTKHKMGF